MSLSSLVTGRSVPKRRRFLAAPRSCQDSPVVATLIEPRRGRGRCGAEEKLERLEEGQEMLRALYVELGMVEKLGRLVQVGLPLRRGVYEAKPELLEPKWCEEVPLSVATALLKSVDVLEMQGQQLLTGLSELAKLVAHRLEVADQLPQAAEALRRARSFRWLGRMEIRRRL